MPKNDNPHAVRFCESMAKNCGEAEAQRIAELFPLSKSANIEKKFEWAKKICEYLEKSYDENQLLKIRMDCACGPEMGKINKLKTLYQKCRDEEEFIQKANQLNQGFTIDYSDGCFELIYPQCYCSCVKRVEQQLSKTWCYCTLGYTKRMFEHLLDSPVEVTLLQSVKMGDDVCRIRVHKLR